MQRRNVMRRKKHLCDICKKPIVLVPSIESRMHKTGQSREHFLSVFTVHADCFLKKRRDDTADLMYRIVAAHSRKRVLVPVKSEEKKKDVD